MTKPKIALLSFGVTLGLALVVAGAIWLFRPYTFHGSYIKEAFPASDFSLIDQHGQPFQLSKQRGHVLLLFFGYTLCPDVCPLTVAHFKQIRGNLGQDAEQVKFLFITTDPEVDTPEILDLFLNKFDSTFIGLTGSRAELEPIWKNYGVYEEKESTGSVDHSAYIYVIDAQGNLRLTSTADSPAEDILSDVQQLIRMQGN
jgi:protein SCO1/2